MLIIDRLPLSTAQRQALVVAVSFAAYLACVHYPHTFVGVIRFALLFKSQNKAGGIDAVASYVYLCLPALFLVCALAIGHLQGFSWLASAARIVSGLAIAIASLDLLFAPVFMGAFSTGAAANVQLLIAVSVLCWQVLVFGWAGDLKRARRLPGLANVKLLLLVPIVALMIFSALSLISAAAQAALIAGGQPYCIATTEDGLVGAVANQTSYRAIRSWEALRGTRLYTTWTGYKSTSQWYFHAILIVDGQRGNEYWNWSARRMMFEPIRRPGDQVANPMKACTPAHSFLSGLGWL